LRSCHGLSVDLPARYLLGAAALARLAILACVSAFVTAGAGFLLAVLWFDLMFDVQVLGHRDGDLPETVLASIAGYYARVTTAARPMNRLIATVMLATLAAIVVQIARADDPRWVAWTSLALVAGPVGSARAWTHPTARARWRARSSATTCSVRS
jgi:hypothetical protein